MSTSAENCFSSRITTAPKVKGIQPAQFAVIPSAQGLCPYNPALFIIHLRLIPDLNVSGFDGRREIIDDFRYPFSFLPLLRIIEFEIGLAAVPYSSLRYPCQVKHVVYIDISEILRCQHIDAAAKLNPVFPAPIKEIVLHGYKDISFILVHFLFSSNKAEHGKMITVNTADRLIL